MRREGPLRLPARLLDAAFKIGIALKGIDGVLELAGGFILAVSPAHLNLWVRLLTAHELSEDPTDIVATHLRALVARVTTHPSGFASVYLLVHGLLKVALAAAVLRGRLWAYPWAMGFIGLFAAYSAYRAIHSSSFGLGTLAMADVVIVALLWWERWRI
ncbi:MAG: DUF2127 domain-containing protein [Elusimicrobia bacterium]|nr:DUF2127 domain-containing protein [Elusimicrobiota bacterium]